jgi:hypothetical protein
MFVSLVIVHYFHVVRVTIQPSETEPPLLVDPYAVLSMAIALQSLKPVTGWYTQFIQVHNSIQYPQFPHGGPLDVMRQFAGYLSPVDLLGL